MNKEFREIFEGLTSAYGQYIPSNVYSVNGKQKGRPFTIKKPVTEELWIKHLDGKEPALGIIPINEKNLCRWGCIDIDQYDFNHKKFIKKIKQKNLPLVVCRSKSGGAHVFLFVSEWIPAALMRAKLKIIASDINIFNAALFRYDDSIVIPKVEDKDSLKKFIIILKKYKIKFALTTRVGSINKKNINISIVYIIC